jgi:hypothetical protein
MYREPDEIEDLKARLAQEGKGSESYWGLKGRLSDLRRVQRNAMRDVHYLGIKYQTLSCGCTWDQVLAANGHDWRGALKFWMDAAQWESEHPNQSHHEHAPQQPYYNQYYNPGYYMQPSYYPPPQPYYSPPYYGPPVYNVHYAQHFYVLPSAKASPQVSLDDLFDTESRDDGVDWAENERARRVWDEGMG